MKKLLLIVGVAVRLFLGTQQAEAQATAAGYVGQQEVLHNHVLSIEFECDAYGNFDAGDGTTDYEGVSIGGGNDKGCLIVSPNGSSNTASVPVFDGYPLNPPTPTLYEPVTESGNWDYYASFWMYLWPCDPESEDCVADDGNTYSHEDPWDSRRMRVAQCRVRSMQLHHSA